MIASGAGCSARRSTRRTPLGAVSEDELAELRQSRPCDVSLPALTGAGIEASFRDKEGRHELDRLWHDPALSRHRPEFTE
jgi:hypothetical protein